MSYYKQYFPIWNTKALGSCFLLFWNLRLPIDIVVLQLSNHWALFLPEYSADNQRVNRICFWIKSRHTRNFQAAGKKKTSRCVGVHAQCHAGFQLWNYNSIWRELQTKWDRLGRWDMTPPDSLPCLYSFWESDWDQMFLSSWNFWRSVFSISLSC